VTDHLAQADHFIYGTWTPDNDSAHLPTAEVALDLFRKLPVAVPDHKDSSEFLHPKKARVIDQF
jgi:hypothetical protein